MKKENWEKKISKKIKLKQNKKIQKKTKNSKQKRKQKKIQKKTKNSKEKRKQKKKKDNKKRKKNFKLALLHLEARGSKAPINSDGSFCLIQMKGHTHQCRKSL